MYTRWHMAIFLFMGCIGTSFLLYSALCLVKEGGKRRPLSAIVAAIFSSVAVIVLTFSLNEPSKILHLLAKPTSGLSSGIIGQIAVVVMALVLYFKSTVNKPLFAGIAGFIAIVSALFLSNIYMIPSRPAIDTFLLYVLLILIVMQAAGYIYASEDLEPLYSSGMLGLALLYVISLMAFLFRLATLVPEDRLFTFTAMSSGTLAPMFWGVFIFSGLLPAVISVISVMRKEVTLPKVQQVSFGVGVFIFCLMINQVPIIVKSIINRPV